MKIQLSRFLRLNLFLLIFFSLNTHSQVVTDKTFHNFGEITRDDVKFVDFKFTNASSSNISITKSETPYGTSLRFSSRSIKPDESILVRVKYTPKRKGEFKADVPIYVSSNSQPIILTIAGNALSFNIDESLEVPDFSDQHQKMAKEMFDLEFRVIKKDDKSPVENAKLDIIWDGVLYKSLQTNAEGKVTADFVSDNYYFVATATGLGSFESEMSIHENVLSFTIELGPQGTLSAVTQDSADVYETEIVEKEIPVIPTPVVVQESSSFPDDEFAPNNIVFLIDVSVSMKQKGKMNLLKSSLVELTNLLRSVDKVAIVTYSTNAQLVLKSTSAANKSQIIEVIQGLEPQGSTSGQQGLKKAYQVLADNTIPGGNNQVFISTDGAFNLEKQDKGMLDTVKKNAKKGYKISVIGIKNEKWTIKNMKLIAEEGNGNYLHITSYEDAKNSLVDEVKFQSKHNP